MTPPADVSPDQVALAEAEEAVPFERFFENANLRDQGEEVAQALPAPAPEPEPEPPEPEPDEPTATPEPPKPAAAKPQPRHGYQARVQEAVARQRQAERERDEARAQLAQIQQPRPAAPPAPPPPQAPSADDPEPQLAQFGQEADPYTAYLLARADHQTRQRFRAMQQQQLQVQTEHRNRTLATQIKGSLDQQWSTHKAANPDFEATLDPEVTGSLRYLGYLQNGEFDPGNPLGNLVALSGQAPSVLSYFSTHKDHFRKVAALDPVLQGFELGRIIEQVTRNGHGRGPQAVSQAKPPIKRPAAAALPGAGTQEEDTDDSEAALLRHIRNGNAAEGRHRGLRRLR